MLARNTNGSTNHGAPNAKTWGWLFGGHLLLMLGLAGLALPLLPTTIFWIGAAACFARSSPRMYRRIVDHSRVGRGVEDFLNHNVIAPAGKVAALAGMAGAAALIAFSPLASLPSHLALIALALAAGYVLTRPNRVATPAGTRWAESPGERLGGIRNDPAETRP